MQNKCKDFKNASDHSDDLERHGQRDELHSRTNAIAGTGSGDGATVQNAAPESFELTDWSEVYLQQERFYPACSTGMMSIFGQSMSPFSSIAL